MSSEEDGESGGGVESRVLSTLLNEMDGVGDTRGVLILGATNAPWEMDEALLRPGRFDQKLLIGPATFPGDVSMLAKHFGEKMGLSNPREELLARMNGWSPTTISMTFRYVIGCIECIH